MVSKLLKTMVVPLLAVRTDSYKELLNSISSLIEQGRKTAVRQINTVLVATYWLMGRQIVEHELKGKKRAEYGEALLQSLASDLSKRFGKGFGYANLNFMRQFYLTYAPEKILQTVSRESLARRASLQSDNYAMALGEIARCLPLSWSHYCLLMRIEDPQKRAFYERLCLDGHWSVRQLDRENQSMLYERTALSKRRELVLKKANENPIVVRPEDEIKDSYVLEFLNLKNEYSETDLEDALIHHLERFLLELGAGFAFVARQKRFSLGGDEYRMDLVLFHIPLKCYVILDLKIGRFTHEYAGQMNLYLNWAKDHLIPQAENDPVGIILCADKNNACVKYATGGLSNKIFVSKYQLKLPKPGELERELERGRDLFLRHGTVLQKTKEITGEAER